MSARNGPAAAGPHTDPQFEQRVRDTEALVAEHRRNMRVITERLTQNSYCTGGETSRHCAQADTRELRREEEAVDVEVQHETHSPVTRSFLRSSAPTPDSRYSRYEQEEREEKADHDDEKCCKCSRKKDDIEVELGLRGGMGARDKDEELVDEMLSQNATPGGGGNGKEESLQTIAPDAGSDASVLPSPHLPHVSETNENAPTKFPKTCAASSATSFDFFPLQSTIVFPGYPPHIYQFPSQSTLAQIREILDCEKSRESLKDEPHILRALQIMRIREGMGVDLPNGLGEKVTIGIPDISGVALGAIPNGQVKIAAWQALGTDDGKPSEPWESVGIDQSLSSDEDIELFLDLNDLINVLDTDKHPQLNSPCGCDACAEKGQTSPSKAYGLLPTPEVSFRGGGSSYGHSLSWYFDSDGSRQFPMTSSTRPSSPNTPLPTAQRYGTFTPEVSHEIRYGQASYESLSIRLSRLMFSPRLIREREDNIRRFDWQHIKQLNPQHKDKSARGFRYTKGPYCEDWATQLDKHREHCDYCQAVFIEEELGAKFFGLRDYVASEDDAPMPRAGEGQPWKEGTWPDKSNTTTSLRFVGDPDPRLRGDAGDEKDIRYDSDDSEDWRTEWDDLASQIQCRYEKPGARFS